MGLAGAIKRGESGNRGREPISTVQMLWLLCHYFAFAGNLARYWAGKLGTGTDLVEAIGPVKISGRKSKFLSDIARNFRAANAIMLKSFDHTARRNLPSAFMP